MNIAVFGLGKLGTPLAAVLAGAGHIVRGVDLSQDYVDAINERRSPVREPGVDEILARNIELSAATDGQSAARWATVIFIVVPTPSREDGTYSDEFVVRAAWAIGRGMGEAEHYQTVVLVSTVMPGTTENVLVPTLEQYSRKECGRDFGVCYSPEFIALGNVVKGLREPDVVLVGESDVRAGDMLCDVYGWLYITHPPFYRMSFRSAEAAKILLNCYVTMKISFANMVGELAERDGGLNATAIVDCLGADSRIGRKFLTPGTAFGGPCFPRDGRAVLAFGQAVQCRLPLVEATDASNILHRDRLVDRAATAVARYDHKVVGVLGLAYKPGTPVCEESPGVHLRNALVARGIEVVCYDPMVSPTSMDWPSGASMAELLEECVRSASVLVLCTPWPEFSELPNILFSLSTAKTVIDCWRMLANELIPDYVVYRPFGLPVLKET